MRTPRKSWVWTLPVDHGFVEAMLEADDDNRRDIIRRLFYLATVAAEDGAGLTVEGQAAGLDRFQIADIAARLRALGETIEIIANAIAVLLGDAG